MTAPIPPEVPHAVEAERVVLGAMLSSPESAEVAQGRLAPADFYDPKHARLFDVLVEEFRAGRPTEPNAILGRLVDKGLHKHLDATWVFELYQQAPMDPTGLNHYLDRIRDRSIRRSLVVVSTRNAQQAAEDTTRSAHALVELARQSLDTIEATAGQDDHKPVVMREFLQGTEEYDWLIPGLIERADRVILTGPESFGKSTLMRQIVVCAAAGVDPFTGKKIDPLRGLVVDCENPPGLNRRRYRPLIDLANQFGQPGTADRLFIESRPEGLDLMSANDSAWLTRQVRMTRPDFLVVGPIYKLHSGDPDKEETARKIIQVIDYIRSKFKPAVLMEAHSPHGDSKGPRPVRPAGTAVWKRWPDFGIGLRPVGSPEAFETDRTAQFITWKARDGRDWPEGVRSGRQWPWVATIPGELEVFHPNMKARST